MSDMRDLMEKSGFPFAGKAVGQTPGDQVRGSEPMPKKGGGKKHPYAGRLVGGCSESVDDLEESLQQEFKNFLAEYGAPGSGIGNDVSINPAEQFALKQQQKAQKGEIQNQITGLMAQVQASRGQMAQLNRAFPQGANPVEKAMALKDMQAQRVQLGRQIEDIMQQVAALRSQAM
jgi:hypothetical protein